MAHLFQALKFSQVKFDLVGSKNRSRQCKPYYQLFLREIIMNFYKAIFIADLIIVITPRTP